MYYLNKSRNSIKKITLLKVHMNGLFNCHRVGWRKTAANWFGFKKIFYKNRERERERPRSLPSICYVFPQSMGAYWVVENVGIF